ncbi:MAG: phenylacetate--CoA ligase family protein [Gammaproteobacteria bacterium]|nr:phenylacetate--CoA ligase family protein [Gammaproteobacteria bacterium]
MNDKELYKSAPSADFASPARRTERAFHRSLYLGLQQLRGRPVGSAIRRLAEWDALGPERYAELCRERLAAMLRYAARHVPLYRTAPWAEQLSGRDAADLDNWPVLQRDALRQRRAELVSDARGPLRVNRRSSASTGAPVTVTWNPTALAWSWAAEYHPMLWHGLSLGARTLRIWGSGRPLENWTLNRHFVPAHDLAPDRLDAALRYLDTRRPELVWGSPSSVTELARHAGRVRGPATKPLVEFAKVGGEQLYAFQRDEIRRYLGARVIEAYGCTEMGPVAAECPRGSLHLLESNVHVEIFRDGAPVPPGETGDIVATTLINRGMPLVRCRIGDIGRISPEPCNCGLPQPVLAELRGRAADLLVRADGTAVHASVLGDALARYVGKAPLGHARKIQFHQVDRRNWRVEVEAPSSEDRGHEDRAALEAQVSELVRGTFGAECRAQCEVVDRIPREASGKYRYYRVPTEPVAPSRYATAPYDRNAEIGDGGDEPHRRDTAGMRASASSSVTDAPPPSAV